MTRMWVQASQRDESFSSAHFSATAILFSRTPRLTLVRRSLLLLSSAGFHVWLSAALAQAARRPGSIAHRTERQQTRTPYANAPQRSILAVRQLPLAGCAHDQDRVRHRESVSQEGAHHADAA